MHNFFIFNQDSKKLIRSNNSYGQRSRISIIEFRFNNNTYFLVEESIFNHLLLNILLLYKLVNSIDHSTFTTTSFLLIKTTLELKKSYLFIIITRKDSFILFFISLHLIFILIRKNFILVQTILVKLL